MHKLGCNGRNFGGVGWLLGIHLVPAPCTLHLAQAIPELGPLYSYRSRSFFHLNNLLDLPTSFYTTRVPLLFFTYNNREISVPARYGRFL